jgi:hypothetical protein
MPSSGLHMLVGLARRALKGGTAFASWVTQASLFSAAWLISQPMQNQKVSGYYSKYRS